MCLCRTSLHPVFHVFLELPIESHGGLRGLTTGSKLPCEELKLDSKPGQVVSVDQIVSAQPGLLPQEKGQLTRARVWGCTLFVDHFTNSVCIVLMRDLWAEATLEAKKEFEHKCAIRCVKVQRYHADNGRFAEKLFKDDCKAQGQHLTFCGVGAHYQNGIVERTIKDVTLATRTILLHAMRYWPEYITTMLCPFAAKCIKIE